MITDMIVAGAVGYLIAEGKGVAIAVLLTALTHLILFARGVE